MAKRNVDQDSPLCDELSRRLRDPHSADGPQVVSGLHRDGWEPGLAARQRVVPAHQVARDERPGSTLGEWDTVLKLPLPAPRRTRRAGMPTSSGPGV